MAHTPSMPTPHAASPAAVASMAHAPTAGFSFLASDSKSAMVSIRTSMAGVGARRAGITGANASMLGAIDSAMIGSRYKGSKSRGGSYTENPWIESQTDVVFFYLLMS